MKELTNFPNLMEAELFASRLKAFGIEAEVADRHMSGGAPWVTPLFHGTRVMVADEDFERALKILAEGPVSAADVAGIPELSESDPIFRSPPGFSNGAKITQGVIVLMVLLIVGYYLFLLVR